jgi:hypothetical protein
VVSCALDIARLKSTFHSCLPIWARLLSLPFGSEKATKKKGLRVPMTSGRCQPKRGSSSP